MSEQPEVEPIVDWDRPRPLPKRQGRWDGTGTGEGDLVRIRQAASLYLELGLRPGGTVAVLDHGGVASEVALAGARAVGTGCPVEHTVGEDELEMILDTAGAEIVVSGGADPGAPPWLADLWDRSLRVTARVPTVKALLAVGSPAPLPAVNGRIFLGDFESLCEGQPAS